MKFLTGDDTGILKLIRVEAQKVERFGPQRRGDCVERLCWAGPEANAEARIAVGHASGAVEIRDGTSGQVLGSATIAPGIRCLQALRGGPGARGILAVSSNGSAGIVAGWCDEALPETSDHTEGDATAESGAVVRRFELPGPIVDAKVEPRGFGQLVFGGGENDVKVWDLTTSEVVWRAKNVREDTLCLRVPVNVSCLQWATEAVPSRNLVLCGTSDGKVRLYDVKAQRRPLFELKVGYGAGAGTGGYTGTMDEQSRPLKCSAIASVRGGDSWSLFVGNTMGVMREYDLRNLSASKPAPHAPGKKAHLKWAAKQMPFKRGYRGIMGSIRDVDVHCSGEVMVAVGIGRFAYVFETRKRRMNSKVYLKQKLCSVLLSAEERKGSSKQDSDDDMTGDEAEDGEECGSKVDGSDDEVQEGFSDDEGLSEDGHQKNGSVPEDEEGPDSDDLEDEESEARDGRVRKRNMKRPAVASESKKQKTLVIMPDEVDESATGAGKKRAKKLRKKVRKLQAGAALENASANSSGAHKKNTKKRKAKVVGAAAGKQRKGSGRLVKKKTRDP